MSELTAFSLASFTAWCHAVARAFAWTSPKAARARRPFTIALPSIPSLKQTRKMYSVMLINDSTPWVGSWPLLSVIICDRLSSFPRKRKLYGKTRHEEEECMRYQNCRATSVLPAYLHCTSNGKTRPELCYRSRDIRRLNRRDQSERREAMKSFHWQKKKIKEGLQFG